VIDGDGGGRGNGRGGGDDENSLWPDCGAPLELCMVPLASSECAGLCAALRAPTQLDHAGFDENSVRPQGFVLRFWDGLGARATVRGCYARPEDCQIAGGRAPAVGLGV